MNYEVIIEAPSLGLIRTYTPKKEKFLGTGSETELNLTFTPVADSVSLYINGILQEEGSGFDYEVDVDLKKITLAVALKNGYKAEVNYGTLL